jgi:hypothetical protein
MMKPSTVRKPDKAMKQTLLTWRCPLCAGDAEFVRGTQEHLDMIVAAHILQHESKASLLAVDRARLSCPVPECSIGRKNHVNLSLGSAFLTLSDFDKTWLMGMRISPD